MKKKVIITLITVCTMLFAFGMINASAETSGTCGDNLIWTLDSVGTLTITGQGNMGDWSYSEKAPWYSIKSDIVRIIIEDGVTSIEEYAFYMCNGVISISIPDSITNIGQGAFSYCSSLTNIVIPDSVTSIGESIFKNCSKLSTVNVPKGVTSISAGAFFGCRSLTTITIPSEVTSLEEEAFYECSSLTNITIPDGVTNIGRRAFYRCSSLINITIPNGVSSIDISTFFGCVSLTNITIPNSVKSIGQEAFYECSSLTNITIPDSVTSLGDSVFEHCNKLSNITISDGIITIPESAFSNCSNLKYIYLSHGILYIRNKAFNNCSNIEIVFYEGNETQWNDILFYDETTNLSTIKIVYNATKKTYKFDTNCNNTLDDVTDYAIFTMPIVENDGLTLAGWYDNSALSGNPITFPYYGDATTLYAAWTDKTGKSFEDAFIAKANQEYTVSTTESGQLVYFEFVPKLSKEYRFYTTGSKDTYGYLYNSSKTQLRSDDDSGDGNNFYISYNLTAGETYYIAAKLYSGTGTFTFVVEEPVDYRINEITIKDISGNNLQAIPTGTFLATVSFTNVSSSTDSVIILAEYTDAGAFKGLMYIQTEDVPIGSTIKLSIPVDNSKGDVAKLKAFCWESFGSAKPMGNSVSFPTE